MSLAGKKKTLIFKEQRLDLFWGFFSLLGVGQTARLLVMKLVLRDPDPFLCRRHQNTKRKKEKKSSLKTPRVVRIPVSVAFLWRERFFGFSLSLFTLLWMAIPLF